MARVIDRPRESGEGRGPARNDARRVGSTEVRRTKEIKLTKDEKKRIRSEAREHERQRFIDHEVDLKAIERQVDAEALGRARGRMTPEVEQRLQNQVEQALLEQAKKSHPDVYLDIAPRVEQAAYAEMKSGLSQVERASLLHEVQQEAFDKAKREIEQQYQQKAFVVGVHPIDQAIHDDVKRTIVSQSDDIKRKLTDTPLKQLKIFTPIYEQHGARIEAEVRREQEGTLKARFKGQRAEIETQVREREYNRFLKNATENEVKRDAATILQERIAREGTPSTLSGQRQWKEEARAQAKAALEADPQRQADLQGRARAWERTLDPHKVREMVRKEINLRVDQEVDHIATKRIEKEYYNAKVGDLTKAEIERRTRDKMQSMTPEEKALRVKKKIEEQARAKVDAMPLAEKARGMEEKLRARLDAADINKKVNDAILARAGITPTDVSNSKNASVEAHLRADMKRNEPDRLKKKVGELADQHLLKAEAQARIEADIKIRISDLLEAKGLVADNKVLGPLVLQGLTWPKPESLMSLGDASYSQAFLASLNQKSAASIEQYDGAIKHLQDMVKVFRSPNVMMLSKLGQRLPYHVDSADHKPAFGMERQIRENNKQRSVIGKELKSLKAELKALEAQAAASGEGLGGNTAAKGAKGDLNLMMAEAFSSDDGLEIMPMASGKRGASAKAGDGSGTQYYREDVMERRNRIENLKVRISALQHAETIRHNRMQDMKIMADEIGSWKKGTIEAQDKVVTQMGNYATKLETYRHNLVGEKETERHNLEMEKLRKQELMLRKIEIMLKEIQSLTMAASNMARVNV